MSFFLFALLLQNCLVLMNDKISFTMGNESVESIPCHVVHAYYVVFKTAILIHSSNIPLSLSETFSEL
jgi:hypothetical protein